MITVSTLSVSISNFFDLLSNNPNPVHIHWKSFFSFFEHVLKYSYTYIDYKCILRIMKNRAKFLFLKIEKFRVPSLLGLHSSNVKSKFLIEKTFVRIYNFFITRYNWKRTKFFSDS